MKSRKWALLFSVILFAFPAAAQAPWSGIISSSRATTWSGAGVVGGVPDSNWAQCVTSACNQVTSAGSSASGAQISAALASAPARTYVLLKPGTYSLGGSQILFPASGNVVLRGSGANSTFLVPSAAPSCADGGAVICFFSSDSQYLRGGVTTAVSWSGGYAQGTNRVTLSSAAGINSSNPTMVVLEQSNTGYVAVSPSANPVGVAIDNGNLFVCEDQYNGISGCSNDGPGNNDVERGQFEMSYATSVSGNVVTLGDALIYPNWTPAQQPRAWYIQPVSTIGIENLSMDASNIGANYLIDGWNAFNYWVTGCRFSNFSEYAFFGSDMEHGTIQSNYFYHSTGSDSYAIRFIGAGQNAIQNNIITQVFAPIVFDGPSSGNVIAYNYIINDNFQNDFMRGSTFEHAVNGFDLYEGNVTNQLVNDTDHGTANMITWFRNLTLGWDSCANGQCGSNINNVATNAMFTRAWGRYGNLVGGVSGTAGFHNAYNSLGSNTSVYQLGVGNGATSPPNPNDPLVFSTTLLWGNYDVVTGAARWCGSSSDAGWGSVCASRSEIPTTANTYPNSIPTKGDTGAGMQALPPSFYLSSQPAWWGSNPWPAIGPDVSGGNVGVCSGTLNSPGEYAGMPALSNSECSGTSLSASSWGGHVNAIPALSCYLNVMGGVPDGTGSELSFNAASCYGGSLASTPPPPAPQPPTNLSVVVH